MATANRRASDATAITDVPYLKMRIASLEKEVADYKKRLDELRKAKNQTILKQEKQYLQISNPISERNHQQYEKTIKSLEEKLSTQQTDCDKELEFLRENHQKELSALKQKHEEELSKNSVNVSDNTSERECIADTGCCEHIEQIQTLQLHNNALTEEVENLLLQMSIKEATWCEREEILKKSIETNWQSKYAEWMRQMERKIAELQETNNMLRGTLERHRPNNP